MESMSEEPVQEIIFVGLPGPTHHYGGLSADNVASGLNRGSISNPRLAALQALELVRLLMKLGVRAAILPPQRRPHIGLLRQHLGPLGDMELLTESAARAQSLLEKASSSSFMWTANAGTVSPVADTADGKLHITVANLFSNLHRRIEAEETLATLKAIFASVPDCLVHAPLSAAAGLLDEGAANHMRLCPRHKEPGINIFVYGTDGRPRDPESARQSLAASQAVARQHRLDAAHTLFFRQDPDAIRAGVFHNDVIAVSNENTLLAHERAFADMHALERIGALYAQVYKSNLDVLAIKESDLTLEEAVHTYFFNSQIVTRPDGGMTVIAPGELQSLYGGKAAKLMERLATEGQSRIDDVRFVDLRQSMRNGGGPACLRLRVVLTKKQIEALQTHVRVLADEVLLTALEQMIERYYPESLTAAQLGEKEPALRAFEAVEKCRRLMLL